MYFIAEFFVTFTVSGRTLQNICLRKGVLFSTGDKDTTNTEVEPSVRPLKFANNNRNFLYKYPKISLMF
jgi:hypothetical protein